MVRQPDMVDLLLNLPKLVRRSGIRNDGRLMQKLESAVQSSQATTESYYSLTAFFRKVAPVAVISTGGLSSKRLDHS
jgi:hypothetical protein